MARWATAQMFVEVGHHGVVVTSEESLDITLLICGKDVNQTIEGRRGGADCQSDVESNDLVDEMWEPVQKLIPNQRAKVEYDKSDVSKAKVFHDSVESVNLVGPKKLRLLCRGKIGVKADPRRRHAEIATTVAAELRELVRPNGGGVGPAMQEHHCRLRVLIPELKGGRSAPADLGSHGGSQGGTVTVEGVVILAELLGQQGVGGEHRFRRRGDDREQQRR
mmetsp:Transcript_41722/g.116309  ORF Transcript_41722/g.116309 Transcript_41722/m.116309 type:complete len:221 (-) Transcript_41722:59-721(-)